MSEQPLLRTVAGSTPAVDETAWVAPGAVIVGDVRLGPGASIWYAAVLRADNAPITIGANSNLQDGCVAHVDTDVPVTVGSGVSVGHRAVLHGCTVEDDCLIGMGAVLLNRSHIGARSMVAAGAVVLQDTQVPPGSLVAGIPAKVRRELSEQERQDIVENAEHYLTLRDLHRAED